MATHKIIFISIVCFSLAVFAGQKPLRVQPKFPQWRPGMTGEEFAKEIKEAKQKEQENRKEYLNLMVRQAWMRLLRITEQEWMRIEPKNLKVLNFGFEANVGAGYGGRNEQDFHWNRPSDSHQGSMEGKTRDQMPEGYRIVEELIDLLENEKSTDEEVRKKIDALHQARAKARTEYAKAVQELAAVITTPRQEAVFLIMGYID
jgi:hypothetical protein